MFIYKVAYDDFQKKIDLRDKLVSGLYEEKTRWEEPLLILINNIKKLLEIVL
jgi:hypothetical protein